MCDSLAWRASRNSPSPEAWLEFGNRAHEITEFAKQIAAACSLRGAEKEVSEAELFEG